MLDTENYEKLPESSHFTERIQVRVVTGWYKYIGDKNINTYKYKYITE